MSGIYIHIPFCKQACHYCDFHFSTNLTQVNAMHQAICKELSLRKDFLNDDLVETIYFGGGTPSILSSQQLHEVIERIGENYKVSDSVELTLEANPDDLSKTKIEELKSIGFNRLSIGVQTFDDDRLKYINRTHTSQEAIESIRNAQNSGFNNLTADLIYAIPPESLDYWQKDLEQMVALGLPHISLYGLTIEEKTVFGNWLAKGKLHETPEEMAAMQYRFAIETLTKAGYQHYEVSNFAKPGFESRHNSAYWAGKKYLGIGPGAHSYDTACRSYNIQNNAKYIHSLNEGKVPLTTETLSEKQKLNEYLLTRLRTAKGINLANFALKFGVDLKAERKEEINQFMDQKLVNISGSTLSLTIDGFMIADEIALRLFYDE